MFVGGCVEGLLCMVDWWLKLSREQVVWGGRFATSKPDGVYGILQISSEVHTYLPNDQTRLVSLELQYVCLAVLT